MTSKSYLTNFTCVGQVGDVKGSVYIHLDLMQRELRLPLVGKSISRLTCIISFTHIEFCLSHVSHILFGLPLIGTIVNVTKDCI